jgi:hypothetical protein
MKPGSLQGSFLVVEDIEATRDDLISRGVEVSEIWHIAPGKGRVPRLDPQRRLYFSRARSRTPTATPGSCRRSRSDSRAACGTPGRWPSSCARRLSSTARSRQSPRGTTRGTGTAPTWTPASRASPGCGIRGRRALHGRHQAHRRRIRLTPLLIAAWRPRPCPGVSSSAARGSPTRRSPDPSAQAITSTPGARSPRPRHTAHSDDAGSPILAKATRSARWDRPRNCLDWGSVGEPDPGSVAIALGRIQQRGVGVEAGGFAQFDRRTRPSATVCSEPGTRVRASSRSHSSFATGSASPLPTGPPTIGR